jgi:hypothetical protein
VAKPRTRSKPERPRGATTDVKSPARPRGAATDAKPPSFDDYALFSFRYADRAHDDGWRWCQGDEWQHLLDFLCEMSRLTWKDIHGQTAGGHKKHHYHDPARIVSRAQQRLVELEIRDLFDDSEFFRFRLQGKHRLWGYLRASVFYVLWWDHDHRVYPLGH